MSPSQLLIFGHPVHFLNRGHIEPRNSTVVLTILFRIGQPNIKNWEALCCIMLFFIITITNILIIISYL